MNDECRTMNDEAKHDLRVQSTAFALRSIKMYAALPNTTAAQVIGKQVLRSGTSGGAHYREAMRARSTPEFVSKVEVGLQELEETDYWLELLTARGIVPTKRLADLRREANELTAILVSSVKTAKSKKMI